MYFCEHHSSVSDADDIETVIHFAAPVVPAKIPAPAAPAELTNLEPDPVTPSLFQDAEVTRSYSAPNSPRPIPASAAAAAAVRDGGGRRQRNASVCSQQPQPSRQLSPEHVQVRQHQNQRVHNHHHYQQQQQQSQSPPPPPYPRHAEFPSTSASAAVASASSAATSPFGTPPSATLNGGVHDSIAGGGSLFRPVSAAAAAAASAGYAFQEVREISLGRHNEEPFGMKIESDGEAFFITHVVRNSAAACAGLKVGDEIVRINDRRLDGLRTREVLQIIRQSELCVKLAFRPRAVVARIREVRLQKDNGVLGLRLQKKSDGLYIDFVKSGTVAHGAGLKDGDQVLKINNHIVTDWTMEGAMALLKSMNDCDPLVLMMRETLPVAHVTPTSGDTPDCNGGSQQPQLFLRRQASAAASAGRNGVAGFGGVDSGGCPGPSERTASCSRLGEVVEDGAATRRVLGTNPCTSSDELQITRLPPEADLRRAGGGSASAAASPASGSASSFFRSPRLTAFLKSTRHSRHQQPQQRQPPPGGDCGSS